jgi:ABC-type branched-subunit amino acid transport system ATPase component
MCGTNPGFWNVTGGILRKEVVEENKRDDPSLGLAPRATELVFEKINDINVDGTTILSVEQNAKRALSISHHAIVLELGKKRFEGTGEEIMHNEHVKRLYLGG